MCTYPFLYTIRVRGAYLFFLFADVGFVPSLVLYSWGVEVLTPLAPNSVKITNKNISITIVCGSKPAWAIPTPIVMYPTNLHCLTLFNIFFISINTINKNKVQKFFFATHRTPHDKRTE